MSLYVKLGFWLRFYPTLKTQALGWTVNAEEIITAIDPVFAKMTARSRKDLVSILMDAHVFLPHELVQIIFPAVGIEWIRRFDMLRPKITAVLLGLRHDSFISLVCYTMTQVKHYMNRFDVYSPQDFDDLVSFAVNDVVTEKIVGEWLPEYEIVIGSDRYGAYDGFSISTSEAQQVLLYGPEKSSQRIQEVIRNGMVQYLHSLGTGLHLCPFDIQHKRRQIRDELNKKLKSKKRQRGNHVVERIKADITLLDRDIKRSLESSNERKLCWV